MDYDRHDSHIEIQPGVFLERMGLCFEDIEVGETYEHRPGRTLTLAESERQTLRALDQAPVVVDVEFRNRTAAGEIDISPLHVLAVATGMMTKTFSRVVANLAWQNVRFLAPVRDGDTIYAESTVQAKRPSKSRPGQGIIQVRTEVRTQNGLLVCTFERLILVYGRGQGPYDAAGY